MKSIHIPSSSFVSFGSPVAEAPEGARKRISRALLASVERDEVKETGVTFPFSTSEAGDEAALDAPNRILQSTKVTRRAPVSARSLPDFWSNMDRSVPIFDCWPYLGPKDRDGYGRYFGKAAHRVAFARANGREPELSVLHTCDNRACCNPIHLYEGTQQENIRDRDERRRTASGERNGRYKHGRYVGDWARRHKAVSA